MDILRNLPVQQPAALRELISIQPGRVVNNKNLIHNIVD